MAAVIVVAAEVDVHWLENAYIRELLRLRAAFSESMALVGLCVYRFYFLFFYFFCD